MWILVRVLLIFCLSLCTVLSQCPGGWTGFHRSCYLLHKVGLTWREASHYCQSRGGYLARVESVAEKDFIFQFLKHTPGYFWIDGIDDVTEGDWRWPSRNFDKIDPLFWYPGEPNSSTGDEDCLETSYYYRGLWNDEDCTSRNYCICEFP